MSNQPVARRSKRHAASTAFDEQDDDFVFTRVAKKAKTTAEPDAPPPVKKAVGRPKQNTGKRRVSSPHEQENAPVATTRRTTRRSSNTVNAPAKADATVTEPKTRKSGRKTRSSIETVEEAEDPPKPRGRTTRRPPDPEADTPGGGQKDDEEAESRQITLPFSDTPIINRNKELRKKGGKRRSSLGMRGRRASSLIENGHNAIPHREVGTSDFYKHIEADGLSEPRRMKQLLTWCGERALTEKPPHGSANSNAVLGARAIQDQLLKDFAQKSEFSDWFAREDEPQTSKSRKKPPVLKPNPRNIEHEEKVAELEARIARLKVEKEKWLSLARVPHDLPPLFAGGDPAKSVPPDESQLDPEEAKILESLTQNNSSFAAVKTSTQKRLKDVQRNVEFKVDFLTSNVHQVEQRTATAARQADRVLGITATRLKKREEKEKCAVGTRDVPVMEVLRSLGRILPEAE